MCFNCFIGKTNQKEASFHQFRDFSDFFFMLFDNNRSQTALHFSNASFLVHFGCRTRKSQHPTMSIEVLTLYLHAL